MTYTTFNNSNDDLELIKLYPTIVYHSIMQGNGNNCNVIFDEKVIDFHSLKNADDEEKSKYPNIKFGESFGKVLLHTDHRCSIIFKEITGHLKQYLEGVLYFNLDLFDYYFVKSWYNFMKPEDCTGFKKRESSDVSFAYFPIVDDGTPYFWVSNDRGYINNLNEIFPEAFSENIKGKKFVRGYNLVSNKLNAIKPQTGSIIIYPSKMPSGLFNFMDMSDVKTKEESIIIQGEIKLTLKPNVVDIEDGLLSINHWRKFNS